jgi:hypothetical protein
MATRTIITSQPDVACDVCSRRLLRGEHPDVFVGAGRRRIVCELCAPRAAHEGWLRETDGQSFTLPPSRARRAGGLFERLRRVTQPVGSTEPALAEPPPPSGGASQRGFTGTPSDAAGESPDDAGGQTPFAGASPQVPPAIAYAPQELVAEVAVQAPAETPSETARLGHEQPSAYLEEAIEVFNASEFPRRVAGVIRSLGAPLVTARSAEHLASVVRIVVAWELCWYRYEVDLSEPVASAQVIAQGTELVELTREDRVGNATAADSGALVLAGVG